MSETLRLLKFHPAVALLIMVNNHLNIHLRPEFVTVGTPTVVEDDVTDVLIQTKPSINDAIYRAYTGEVTYRYRRLNVADVFAGMNLDITPPITIRGVMENIAAASGLAITDNDFENGLVETNSFTLTAKPNSLRWVGSTTVMLNEPGKTVMLADAFPDNVLDGFYAPDFGPDVSLPESAPKTDLDGLIYDPSVS